MSVELALPTIRAEMRKLKIPHTSDKVYKDECVFSFDSPFSDDGLYVNLSTFKGYGKDYVEKDRTSTGNNLYLHLKWAQVEKKADVSVSEAEPTKLAIGVAGGFMTEASYDIVKDHFLVVFDGNNAISIALPNQELPEFVSNVLQAIIDHDGMKSNLQVATWDADNEKFVSKYAKDLVQLNPDGKKIPQDPKLWKDEATGATENLWLNLSTGFIGGGRKNWDGTGGSGSALEHYHATGSKYPLAVKLGTITPHGADVWSYATEEDNLVIDPHLAEHLSFWGIDVMKLEKTDKTMGELEVSHNMTYDWSRILSEGEELEVVSGPGLLGLRNIGSSCYLNSVMQSILAIPEVQERYLMQHENIVHSAPTDPTEDLAAQLSKLAVGVLSSRYVPPSHPAAQPSTTSTSAGEEGGKVANLEKYVLAPRMFKHLVGKGHSEFSSGRQQDVSEYFQYFLEVLSRAERVSLPRVAFPGAVAAPKPTASIFEYHTQVRYQCNATGEVKYLPQGPQTLFNMLDLPVPLDKAVPYVPDSPSPVTTKRARLEGKESEDTKMQEDPSSGGDSAAEKEAEQFIPFEACLQSYLAPESMDMFSSAVGAVSACSKTQRFATFPRYLMVKMSRYYVSSNWVQQKITARIDVPEHLDLRAYRGTGPQSDEKLMAQTDETAAGGAGGAGAAGAGDTPAFQVDEGLVAQLTSMGFSENGCRRAAIATHNADPETAMNWIFEHMEDADFNDPPVLPSSSGSSSNNGGSNSAPYGGNNTVTVDPEAVAMLTSMGYSENQVSAALQATDNNIERAADWLFSHADDLDAAVAQVLSGTSSGATSTTGTTAVQADDGEGKYTLIGIISHLGKNTDHGHYVCHLKKDGQWLLFNDEKVGKCNKVPLEYGFMYLYRRDDGPGTFAL